MGDYRDLHALASEFEAVPAFLIAGPGQQAEGVLVRALDHPEDDGVRLTIENTPKGIQQQLVISRGLLRRLLDDPQPALGS